MRRLVLALVLSMAGLLSPDARADITARTGCSRTAPDCNVTAPRLVDQFKALRDHGDVLGFGLGDAADPTLFEHWQGVQRLSSRGGRYLAVSRKGGGTSFVIVRLSSRDDTGERWRSNRLGADARRVAPPARDKVVFSAKEDAGYHHSGGMQVLGDVLAVGLQGGGKSRVAFWDVGDPRHPERLGTLKHTTGVSGAGTISLAKLAGGAVMLVVGGDDAEQLDFYLAPNLRGLAFRHVETLSMPRQHLTYQNLNLVPSGNGDLYLIGTFRDGPGTIGDDYADLYKVTGTLGAPRLELVRVRHFFCDVRHDQQCDFNAGVGVYVAPSGGLLMYATEHDNDGPKHSIKFEEFRTAPHRPSCATMNDAWVEVYDDTKFRDRSVMVDYLDRRQRPYRNWNRVEDFEDRASSVRWCLPRGAAFRMRADKGPCGGRQRKLVGTGRPEQDKSFKDDSGAVRGFNDKLSCSQWDVPAPVVTPTPAPLPSPSPTPLPTPTPTPTGRPDLVISAFEYDSFTVANLGDRAAGPFVVTVAGAGDYAITGLAAGAAATRAYPQQPCESLHRATADSHFTVTESNEVNNVSEFGCIG